MEPDRANTQWLQEHEQIQTFIATLTDTKHKRHMWTQAHELSQIRKRSHSKLSQRNIYFGW